ncbi:MAG: archease [Desulfobacteraceae bacterium]
MVQESNSSKKSQSGYRLLSHTADLGLRLYGDTLADLFANAARGLYGVMTDRRGIRPLIRQEVEVEAADSGALLVEWLNQLLYLFETTGFLGREIEIKEVTANRLRASLKGEPLDLERHRLNTGIKAATYHNLEIKETAGGWQATIILDI